jgi:hypothetical protein
VTPSLGVVAPSLGVTWAMYCHLISSHPVCAAAEMLPSKPAGQLKL